MTTLTDQPIRSVPAWACDIDLNALGLWRGHSAHESSALGWPIALLPDFLEGSWTLPSDSVERFQHVSWTSPVPDGPFGATHRQEWAVRSGRRSETAVTTEAWVGVTHLASSRIVCSTQAAHPGDGVDGVPAPPRVGSGTVERRLAVTDDQVRAFSAVSGARYAAFAGSSEAGRLGFNNVVVPGPLLAMVHLLAAGMDADHGDLEVWFRRPVTVGSALELVRSDHDPSVWSIRSIATNAQLTIARCSPLR
jgi:hypothetical protein